MFEQSTYSYAQGKLSLQNQGQFLNGDVSKKFPHFRFQIQDPFWSSSIISAWALRASSKALVDSQVLEHNKVLSLLDKVFEDPTKCNPSSSEASLDPTSPSHRKVALNRRKIPFSDSHFVGSYYNLFGHPKCISSSFQNCVFPIDSLNCYLSLHQDAPFGTLGFLKQLLYSVSNPIIKLHLVQDLSIEFLLIYSVYLCYK